MKDSKPFPSGLGIASLHLDILSTLCDCVTERPDLLSLSLTNSVFRPLAIRAMLRSRPVVLKKIATIFKFHDFVFGDAAARMPHILILVIDVADNEIQPNPEYRERAIEALTAILKHSPSLKSLVLSSSANGRPLGYLDDVRVSAAVGEVTTLRELTIGGRTEVADYIGAMHSPLTKLSLHFLNTAGGLDEWSTTDLNAALSRFAHSLETLSIEWSHVRLAGSPPSSSVSTFKFTQLHALRSLTLNNLVSVPHLPLLSELFPNLNGTLHLNQFIYEIPDSEDQDDSQRYDFLRRVREENGTAQEGPQSWTRLERLICDVEALFVLNLRCPVGLTIIHEYLANANSDVRQYLTESLRDHPPTRLNLQLSQWCGAEDPSLGGLIPPEAGAALTHLTLCVAYLYYGSPGPTPQHHTQVRWADQIWRNGLLPALAPLRRGALTHLRLVFHCDAREADVPVLPIARDPLIEDLRPRSRDGGRFDFAAVASALVDALPSLRYCFLTNSARVVEPSDVDAYSVVERWREALADNDGMDQLGAAAVVDTGRGIVELPDSVTETIIEREGLGLSKKEMVSTCTFSVGMR